MSLSLCADDPKSITDCLLVAQKEAEEEDKEMKDVLTDTHIIMTTMDLFGGKYGGIFHRVTTVSIEDWVQSVLPIHFTSLG